MFQIERPVGRSRARFALPPQAESSAQARIRCKRGIGYSDGIHARRSKDILALNSAMSDFRRIGHGGRAFRTSGKQQKMDTRRSTLLASQAKAAPFRP